jgi:DNA invertase Pin-like site-specific DNA recombinase
MPRPLLEIWREQNRDREPSSLLTMRAVGHPAIGRDEEERRLISQRTRDALAAAKERGVVLGNQKQADANRAAAAARDANLRPILEAMQDRPLRAIAEALTDRGIETPRGGDTWNAVSIMRAMRRLGIGGK